MVRVGLRPAAEQAQHAVAFEEFVEGRVQGLKVRCGKLGRIAIDEIPRMPGAIVIVGHILRIAPHNAGRLLPPADGLHEADALFLKDPLHTLDGVAFALEELANAPQQVDIVRTIIAPPAAAFQRLDVGKARFPEAQDVLGQVEVFGDLADGSECVGAFVHGSTRPCG